MKIKDNGGFTLVETLAVIVLLGVALMIAVPSINNLTERSKEKEMIEDAKMFITLVENKVKSDVSIDPNIKNEFNFNDIDTTTIGQSPYGTNYASTSNVKVSGCDENYKCTYTVELIASNGGVTITAEGTFGNITIER